jgi:alkaline phosphatase
MYRIRSGKNLLVAVCAGVALVTATGLAASLRKDDPADQPAGRGLGGRAKNVILFLGDGMGDSEITIARNDQVGANGRLWVDPCPLR